jgi:branched-chain amino acid transport system ATP-binding protein
MEALRVNRLSMNFGGLHAVKDVSFTVEKGERLVIIGPNGAGKTTLFNLLSGQLSPTSGRVSLFGRDITRMKVHERAHLGLARSFQVANLLVNITVLENVLLAVMGRQHFRYQLFRRVAAYDALYSRARELLHSVDLWEKRGERVSSIAYGEQRRLEIALSVASEPRVLLLDEPSCGLTVAESGDITNRIRNLGREITVVLVAHDMDLVFGVAERIIVLHHGEIIIEGMPQEIRDHPKVKEIYMGSEEEG